MTLEKLGWNDFFQQQIDNLTDTKLTACMPARVYRQDLSSYHLWSEQGELDGVLPGKSYFEASSKADLPTVGDWVLVEPLTEEPGRAVIRKLLTRRSKFSRKEAFKETDEQIVAANIDTVFIVSGLDKDFNLRRIERYLLLAWDSGAKPVLVLNKADLCNRLDELITELQSVSMGTDYHVVSALHDLGVDLLRTYLNPGHTIALMGSSGVGKSTLINGLVGEDLLATGNVRVEDSKGKHTTTFRQMVQVTGGGILIDTPGMRELQLWGDEDSLNTAFDDVESIAASCRFKNCQHQDEPGCAIRAGIEDGTLDAERLRSFEKLKRELQFLAEKQDVSAQRERKAERRRFAKRIRKRVDKRDR